MKILYFWAAILALSAAEDLVEPEIFLQKTVVVGDEFPTISVGFLNNKTEYKIELDTSGHSCEGQNRCELFLTLTEMYCKRNVSDGEDDGNQPYIQITGEAVDGKRVDVKWCWEYGINEDFAQDEFVSLLHAVLTPRGDWSKANATVLIMASFYTQMPVNTVFIPVGSSPVDIIIDNDQVEYEFQLDMASACPGGHCSMGAYLSINCIDNSKGSAGIELDVLTVNNRSVSRVLCPLRCVNPSGGHEKMTTYLLNMRKLSVKPTGSWKSPSMFGRMTLSPIFSKDEKVCGENFYNCNEACELGSGNSASEDEFSEGNEELMQMSCVPWAWVCGRHEKYCPNYCSSVRKFCPRPEEPLVEPSTTTATTTTTPVPTISPMKEDRVMILNGTTITREWIRELMNCRMYYLVFFIPLVLILSLFFGTVYLVRRRQIDVELEQQREMNRARQSFHFFGKMPRNIPYQMVENETG